MPLYGDVMASSSTVPVSDSIGLPPVPRVAFPYPTTGPQHLSLSTAAPVTADSTITHAHARPDPYLAVTRPSDGRGSCNAVVWDEQRKSDVGSHVRPVLQTAAGGPPQLAPRPGSSLDHRASRPCAFREVATIPGGIGRCRMSTYLFRRDCFVEAMLFASILAEANPSRQNPVRWKQVRLEHWTLMVAVV